MSMSKANPDPYNAPRLFPISDRRSDTAAPLVYPMYMMPMQMVLEMQEMTAHQILLGDGKLVAYTHTHTDPERRKPRTMRGRRNPNTFRWIHAASRYSGRPRP